MSETITITFVDAAVTVYNRALSVPAIRCLLDQAEIEFGVKTPFSSIYTIEAIIKRASHQEMIEWAVASILHMIKEEHCSVTDIGVRGITGKGTNAKGIVDMTNFRYRFARHVVTVIAERHPFHVETKAALVHMCKSHQVRGLNTKP